MTTLTLDLEPELARDLARAADERRTSVEDLIVSAARRWLADDADASTAQERAEMERSLEDVRAGRLTTTADVFARLDAKHGWS